VLFLITFFTCTVAGAVQFLLSVDFFSALTLLMLHPGLLREGLSFSIPLLVILLAHEMGHYFACRYYGSACTPPFFIPLPLGAGTLGAFIKIKSHFRDRRSLFDIGIAGPLAGFIFLLPALWIGISLSSVYPKGVLAAGGLYFGEPLIFRLFGRLMLNYSPATQDMVAHPIAMAAWIGLLATSLNLLPIWQLDGGHIAYAIFGRTAQKKISISAAIALVFLSFLGWPVLSYLLAGLLLLILGARARFYHPPPLFEDDDLGPGRRFLGLLALLILVLSFIPVPISLS
jgi:membrane-associated protease RseP (regulator of RpoE activity)